MSQQDLDPHRDTPIELLHTWLLGVVKYVWHDLHSSWSEKQQNIFALRLQDTNTDGLVIPPIRAAYMMQYRNGLIGKHFKTLCQTMASKVYGLVSPAQLTLVRAMGELSPMLWMTEIDDMDQHIVSTSLQKPVADFNHINWDYSWSLQDDIKILLGNVLDAFGNIDPARIIVKEKLQVLVHVLDDIKRFGPPPRYSSETFECFNGVFRLSSVHSNHQAPSRDIAQKMAGIECVRHIATGGYWWDEDNAQWVRAGDEVLALFRESPLLQHHFGCTTQIPSAIPGHVTLPPQKKRLQVDLSETRAATANTTPSNFRRDGRCEHGVSVVAQSGDQCRIDSWVIVQNDKASPTRSFELDYL